MIARTIVDYSLAITSASKSVLLELMTILKAYREHIILIGGWVPFFLLESRRLPGVEFTHVGSIDIDLVIDPNIIDDDKYATITQLLLHRDYEPSKDILYQFVRAVRSEIDGREYKVGVDFLNPAPPVGKGRSRRHRQIQPDLKARNLVGAEIAFQSNQMASLEGILPGNGKTRLKFKLASLPSFLALKGIAFGERYKEKDAYDIYCLCDYYDQGPGSVAAEVKPAKDIPVVRKGLGFIRERFSSPDAEGPSWVANFMAIADPREKEEMRQRSYMTVNEMLLTKA